MIITKINPNYFTDMQRVFQTEKSPEDAERYVYKLKSLEDLSVKAPNSSEKVEDELKYELSKMRMLKKILTVKQVYSSTKDKVKHTIQRKK
jgi:hypothetical protein